MRLFVIHAVCPPNSLKMSDKCLHFPYPASSTKPKSQLTYSAAAIECESTFSWGDTGTHVMPRNYRDRQLLSDVTDSEG